MNGPSYRPNKSPGRVVPTGNTSGKSNKNRARTWGITRSEPLGNNAIAPQLDVDNMLKPILDAMIGVVYQDDKQLTDLHGLCAT